MEKNLIFTVVKKHVIENREDFTDGFADWLMHNWQIYLEFETQARIVANSGRKHYSARTIVEYIRHQTLLAETSGSFKINNNHVADLARLFAIRRPNYKNLFEYRVTKKHPKGVIGGAK